MSIRVIDSVLKPFVMGLRLAAVPRHGRHLLAHALPHTCLNDLFRAKQPV